MAWKLLGSASAAGAMLDLYGSGDGAFMIRANGLELMNSRSHATEDVLGRLTADCAGGPGARILIGGLGLGFTLLATCRAAPEQAEIHVAELSPAVADWCRSTVLPGLGEVWPAQARLHIGDVLAVAAAQPPFEVISLDVDNGPEAFTTAANDSLYAPDGLAALRRALSPRGTLLVWSGFRSAAFAADAAASGFAVAVQPHRLAGPGLDYWIYVLQRTD